MSVLRRPFSTWTVLAIIVKYTQIPGIGGGALFTMTRFERAWCYASLDVFPGQIVTLSKGNIAINLTTVETDTVQTTAEPYGSAYTISNDNCLAIRQQYNYQLYDGVMLFCSGSAVPAAVNGLTSGALLGQTGYSYIDALGETVDKARVFHAVVHEWIHQAVSYFNGQGYPNLPDLDQPGIYTDYRTGLAYTSYLYDSGRPIFTDIMTGGVTVPATGARIGITSDMWRNGGKPRA